MNQILQFKPATPDQICQSADKVLIGMPQLALNGLSEVWLLKELGHRHWMLLAKAAGRDVPSFHTELGKPVYAAFNGVRIRGANFASVKEHDRLEINSCIRRVGRARFSSRHDMGIGGRNIGMVELVSTFVHRTAGGNHSIARVEISEFPPFTEGSDDQGFPAQVREMRSCPPGRHMGLKIGARHDLASSTFIPSPSLDFNGAGFLYFSSYLAFVERAEWDHAPDVAVRSSTAERDLFFYANLDPGDGIAVRIVDWQAHGGGFSHAYRIERNSDGATLLLAFSRRVFV